MDIPSLESAIRTERILYDLWRHSRDVNHVFNYWIYYPRKELNEIIQYWNELHVQMREEGGPEICKWVPSDIIVEITDQLHEINNKFDQFVREASAYYSA